MDMPVVSTASGVFKLLSFFRILNPSILSWRFLNNVLIVQEHWDSRQSNSKFRFQFPCGKQWKKVTRRQNRQQGRFLPQRGGVPHGVDSDGRQWEFASSKT